MISSRSPQATSEKKSTNPLKNITKNPSRNFPEQSRRNSSKNTLNNCPGENLINFLEEFPQYYLECQRNAWRNFKRKPGW